MDYLPAILVAAVILVVGFLDSRVRWPKPTEKVTRYVSVGERSKTLRRE